MQSCKILSLLLVFYLLSVCPALARGAGGLREIARNPLLRGGGVAALR